MEYSKGSCEIISLSSERVRRRRGEIALGTHGTECTVISLDDYKMNKQLTDTYEGYHEEASDYDVSPFLNDEAAYEAVYMGIDSVLEMLETRGQAGHTVRSIHIYEKAMAATNNVIDSLEAVADYFETFDVELYTILRRGIELVLERQSTVQ